MKSWINGVVYALLVMMVFMLVLLLVVPVSMRQRVAVVLSGSMEPALRVGALAFSTSVEPEDIRVGDIIAFSGKVDSEITTSHRVIDIIEGESGLMFRTKGDANEEADPVLVPADNVRSRVTYSIPRLGRGINRTLKYVRSWGGLVFLVVAPTLGIIGMTVYDMRYAGDRRKKRLELLRKKARRRA